MARGLARSAQRRFAVIGMVAAMCTAGNAAQIVHADGRREAVEGLRKGNDGRWSYEVEGRRTMAPSDVVAVIDDEGESTETIAALSNAAPTATVEAALKAAREKIGVRFEFLRVRARSLQPIRDPAASSAGPLHII